MLKVARTVQGKSKQFGFVNFTSYKAASRAVEKMHGSLEKGMSLYVTFHQTKSERNSFLEQRLFQRLQGLALKVHTNFFHHLLFEKGIENL